MSRSIDTIIWILMAVGVVWVIGFAIVVVGETPAQARYRVLGACAVAAVCFGYAAVCFLDALMLSSVSTDDPVAGGSVRQRAAGKRLIGLLAAGVAFAVMFFSGGS